MESYTIVIIGAGNVASHLAVALDKIHNVAQIYSRNLNSARNLANRLNQCLYTDNLDCLLEEADLYIISVSDDAISEIVNHMPYVKGTLVHTSGSVGIDALGRKGSSRGVFYPLQTFSKEIPLDMSRVPFFIEGSDSHSENWLKALAHSISGYVYTANSTQRQSLHMAAVFACNFFNHMLVISSRILNDNGYDLQVLQPLLEVTLSKAMTVTPAKAQTGPAVRHDKSTIEKHLSALNGYDKDIYAIISEAIIAEKRN